MTLPNAPDWLGEELADMIWNHEDRSERISIREVRQINACNHVVIGTATVDGVECGFEAADGDIAGFELRQWRLAEDFVPSEPAPPTLYRLLPRNPDLHEENPEMFRVYLEWRKAHWLQELEGKYNYDRHFAPGVKTRNHYEGKAAERGLAWATEEEVDALIKRATGGGA